MTKRLFIAINLPENIIKELNNWQVKLIKINHNQNIKWVDSSGMHITLHFLGDLGEEKIILVRKMLKETVSSFSKTDLTYYQLAAFPNLNEPKVIVLKCQDNKMLSQLQQDLKKELEKLGIETDNRPWQPHITLGRAKDKVSLNIMDVKPQKFEVPSIELMESHLSSAGANYEIIETYLLS